MVRTLKYERINELKYNVKGKVYGTFSYNYVLDWRSLCTNYVAKIDR